jgi:hypothetical protein
MTKITPDIVLDVNQLPATTITPNVDQPLPPELPKHLIDFKKYVESKCCYYPGPLENIELLGVQQKVAYQCRMKILMESREVKWTKKPARWTNSTVLMSTTLGKIENIFSSILMLSFGEFHFQRHDQIRKFDDFYY